MMVLNVEQRQVLKQSGATEPRMVDPETGQE
jgi:hypothetical protein